MTCEIRGCGYKAQVKVSTGKHLCAHCYHVYGWHVVSEPKMDYPRRNVMAAYQGRYMVMGSGARA